MVRLKEILLFILLFAGTTLTANVNRMDFPSIFSVSESQEKTMSLDVIINGTTKIQMENVPLTGYLEIYSILGVKITSVNLKTCIGGCYIDLPKGLYILKAGRIAQKVIVR